MDIDLIFRMIFAAVLGGILGSFANVLIIRWHAGKPLGGRSHCPACKKTIKPRHLIPVVSWLWLRGRCAYCRRKIHPQYVLVEIAAAGLALVAAARWDPFVCPQFWSETAVTVGLLVPLAMDIRWKELPVEFMLGLGALGLLAGGLGFSSWTAAGWASVLSALLAAVASTVFFGGQIVLSRGRWLGEGDFWFGLMMAMLLGWPLVAVAVYAAYVLGGSVAVIGFLSGRFGLKSRLPFAPALAAGTMVAMWYGPEAIRYVEYAFQ